MPQFPSVLSVISCKFLSLRPTAPLGRRSDQIPTHFCPRLADKTPTSVNPTRASRSIAAGTSSTPQTTPNSSRKCIEKCSSQNQYSLLFVALEKADRSAFPAFFPTPPRQNHPILSPFSDFPTFATKFPLRISPSEHDVPQSSCKDKKTQSYHRSPLVPRSTQLLPTAH
jgi:hypothetical protein